MPRQSRVSFCNPPPAQMLVTGQWRAPRRELKVIARETVVSILLVGIKPVGWRRRAPQICMDRSKRHLIRVNY